MRSLAALALALALAGCHHTPTVIQTGPDTYLAGASSRSGFKNDMAVTGVAMNRANDFCQKQGKVADMIDNSSKGHQMLTTQSAQIRFRCVDARPSEPPASDPQ
jgi:uncharacterized Zn-binding protein involved in type VI secretion